MFECQISIIFKLFIEFDWSLLENSFIYNIINKLLVLIMK